MKRNAPKDKRSRTSGYLEPGVVIIFLFPAILFSQQESIDPSAVYQAAYETAMDDGRIDESERALLKSLRASLGLPDEKVDKQLPPKIDQSGRWPLVAQNMIYGAGLYGWIIPYVLDARDFKWYVGTEMISLGAAYYLTYRYTKQMEISHARAQMMRAGSAIGLRYGLGINTLLQLDFEEGKLAAWILMASVPAGIYSGDKLFNRWEPSNGQAWSLTLWTELGGYLTRNFHHFFSTRPDDPEEWEYEYYDETGWRMDQEAYDRDKREFDRWKRANTLFDLVGYPVGAYIGRRWFAHRQYTFGDGMMLYQGRALGWLYGAMIGDVLGMDFDESSGRLFRMGGSVAGPLLFDRFITGKDYTFGEAILTVLGTASGMAFAAGSSVILEIDDENVIEILVMGGGVAGLYLANSILEVEHEGRQSGLSIVPSFSLNPFMSTVNVHLVF